MLKEAIKFDVEVMITELEKLKNYFIEKVKLVNNITLEINGDEVLFEFDIPSTDIDIKLGKDFDFADNKEHYYISVYEYPFEVIHYDITKEQYDKILKILKEIYEHYTRNKKMFDENRTEMLVKILDVISKSKDW